ncbi:MAG: hypothetical protein A3I68_06110 [Candidatus Melainabacteria bacterium RIFCSPLOWO2_02_FULL_35_15]|nr:MAG: hypothetical protein A3F80_08305 [Candidatus Melainabacteria bacterium RIFCSPLOWO2_12_FULL_35_11]OGI14543.1 MAG: hypothetical protein A3I68_06110 [Candidatus Melainabacteria bacterium RIFCSPLOWO2_02_FULL_35_15]
MSKTKISILGAGSWGGTLTWLLSNQGHKVTLWTFSKEEYRVLSNTRALLRPKKVLLGRNIQITTNLKAAITNTGVIIIAVPTNAFKSLILKLKHLNLSKKIILLSATKGITTNDYTRPSQILKKYLPKNKFAILSGPNIALDVISKAPIISVIASGDIKTAGFLQKIISSKFFRIYINRDVNGVEIAGALKNVIAIAAGMSDGFGFNISTKAALISRGLIEISKIAIKEGASAKTLLGAAGIGDLIATCCSKNSRNYKVGYELARGKKLKDILKKLGQTAEGTETVKAMVSLAKKYKINTPIANAVYKIAVKNKNPKTVLEELLNRPMAKYEIEF